MQGLELSRRFFAEWGEPELEKRFPGLLQRAAVGLAGEGSECFGYDDALSLDHDFEPGFCLWLTAEDYRAHGFALERWYAARPRAFAGFDRQKLAPVGGSRHGAQEIGDFYRRFLGTPGAPETWEQWLYLPQQSLACACSGAVFRDDTGMFSRVRETLRQGYPRDVRAKKLAAHSLLMYQAGVYNYPRCLARDERGAAQLAVFEFARHAISLVYLLNGVYEPFYKWVYRGMREFSLLSGLGESLTALTELGNAPEEAAAKQETMEEICTLVARCLFEQGWSASPEPDLEKQAYAVQKGIRDPEIRNLHIMDGAG